MLYEGHVSVQTDLHTFAERPGAPLPGKLQAAHPALQRTLPV